jgi:hypothetical protein
MGDAMTNESGANFQLGNCFLNLLLSFAVIAPLI